MPGSYPNPKLSPKLRKYFERFVHLANLSALHPLDWGRYYNFIANCHRLRSKLSAEDVKSLLINSGFREEYASYLADVYHHGRAIIKVHRGSIPHGATERWS